MTKVTRLGSSDPQFSSTRFAVVHAGGESQGIILPLNATVRLVIDAIYKIPFTGEVVNLAGSLRMAGRALAGAGNRLRAPDVVLLVTGKRSSNDDQEAAIRQARSMRRRGVRILVLDITADGPSQYFHASLTNITGNHSVARDCAHSSQATLTSASFQELVFNAMFSQLLSLAPLADSIASSLCTFPAFGTAIIPDSQGFSNDDFLQRNTNALATLHLYTKPPR